MSVDYLYLLAVYAVENVNLCNSRFISSDVEICYFVTVSSDHWFTVWTEFVVMLILVY